MFEIEMYLIFSLPVLIGAGIGIAGLLTGDHYGRKAERRAFNKGLEYARKETAEKIACIEARSETLAIKAAAEVPPDIVFKILSAENGRMIEMTENVTTEIKHLKKQLAILVDIPVDRQRLEYNGWFKRR